MKTTRILSKISYWLITICMVLLAIIALINISSFYSLFAPIDKPSNTQGMASWQKHVSVSMGQLKWAKQSNLKNNVFSTSHILKLPAPKIEDFRNSETTQPLFQNKHPNDLVANLSSKYQLAEYRILNKNTAYYISIIFTVGWYIMIGIAFIWLVTLRKFLISISQMEFFIRKNAIRLVVLSIPLFLYPLVTFLLNSFSEKWFYKNFQILNGGIVSEVHLNPLSIIIGLIFLMMAGIVKEGTKLKEEQELTI